MVAVNEPIDPLVRLAISQWPDNAPRGAVSTFCAEYGISRKSFYELRKRVKTEGPAAVLEPMTRRPKSSPSKLSDEVKEQALAVRAALEATGLDHGPISVHDKMHAMGLERVPSTASLARVFREAGVARLEPKKKPRSAWRRFVYPAPNACWQLDATEYVLSGGRRCVIFQLIDDHSRYALASHVALSETAKEAIAVVDKAIAAHGVPQRLLSDNGIALNPSRRGHVGQLVAHLAALGVEAITGKPYKPTTQGKNERFHQTLFRYLDKQPIAESLAELQCHVDAFDGIYNTERPHQGLPGRVTPRTAWEATAKAPAPRPKPDPPSFDHAVVRPHRPAPTPADLPHGTSVKTLNTAGAFVLAGVTYKVDGRRSLEQVLVVIDGDKITAADLDGEVLIEHTRPAPGITYVGNGRPRGPHPKTTQTSPKS
ncbi:IS481 family transposase [Mycolicibacterium monacense]|uniref:Integrase n=4 Tax=Mycobacteriaceae TaxID=1762 RepID=A0AAD1J4N5_MYCMB|nr:integrase [Mycolicibacterium monacense DSM 44395]ORB22314.1 IS481 family transposase [Mycolicibacterium monacense DSM 44395]QHP84467.1 IS481 family transposase [Mycolicibacterium monacense DSM 44395]BBZ62772.1 integrase [Mycolicibacterium monacense]